MNDMMLPLQLTARNTTLSPDMEADIRERVARLLVYYDRIIGCRVIVEVPQGRRHDGTLYHVRIDLTVPGGELVIRRRPREELRTAVQLAFNAARRRLQDYARRQRGAVKIHEPQPLGRVSQYYPLAGYGFLEAADGRVIYFDRHSVLDGGFDRLDVGTEVRFAEEEGEKGPQATSVFPLHPRHLKEEM